MQGVEDAIKQTEEQTNIRVYGGHIFASSGEIGKHAQAWPGLGTWYLSMSHAWMPKDRREHLSFRETLCPCR